MDQSHLKLSWEVNILRELSGTKMELQMQRVALREESSV